MSIAYRHIIQSVLVVSATYPFHFFPAAVWAKSAKASFRLNLASSMTPASASEEKFADHWTKVDPSLGPVVTAWHLMVEMTLEYVRAGVEEMTE